MVEVLPANNPVKLIVAPVPAQTVAACDAPDNVGFGFTVTLIEDELADAHVPL